MKKVFVLLVALAMVFASAACAQQAAAEPAAAEPAAEEAAEEVVAEAPAEEAEAAPAIENPVIRLSTTTSVNDSGLCLPQPYLKLHRIHAGSHLRRHRRRHENPHGRADAGGHAKARREYIAEGFGEERVPSCTTSL